MPSSLEGNAIPSGAGLQPAAELYSARLAPITNRRAGCKPGPRESGIGAHFDGDGVSARAVGEVFVAVCADEGGAGAVAAEAAADQLFVFGELIRSSMGR